MLKIKKISVNPLGENCYILRAENGDGAIIDCGASEREEFEAIDRYLKEEDIQLKLVLLTHGHFDHILGLAHLFHKYGVSPWMHRADQDWYDHANEACIQVFGQGLRDALPEVERYLEDGQQICLGDERLEVIHTPGHTQGGVCFYNETNKLLLSGDTLFCESIGRADLAGGNHMQLVGSVTQRLLCLPDDVRVLPGHGRETTIGHERQNNYYLM